MEIKQPKLIAVNIVQRLLGIDIFDPNTAKIVETDPMFFLNIINKIEDESVIKKICSLVYGEENASILETILHRELAEGLIRFFSAWMLEMARQAGVRMPSEDSTEKKAEQPPQTDIPLIQSSSELPKENPKP